MFSEVLRIVVSITSTIICKSTIVFSSSIFQLFLCQPCALCCHKLISGLMLMCVHTLCAILYEYLLTFTRYVLISPFTPQYHALIHKIHSAYVPKNFIILFFSWTPSKSNFDCIQALYHTPKVSILYALRYHMHGWCLVGRELPICLDHRNPSL